MPDPLQRRAALALVILAALGPGPLSSALAGEPDAPARVYTNEDLRQLAPLPSQNVPLATFDAEAWARVATWLDAEHARLEAEQDRRHELELVRRAADLPARRERHAWPVFGAPWLSFAVFARRGGPAVGRMPAPAPVAHRTPRSRVAARRPFAEPSVAEPGRGRARGPRLHLPRPD